MAQPHTTNGAYTNPEVRHERSDVEVGDVFRIGVGATLVLAVLFAAALWYGMLLFRQQEPLKVTDLPPAAAADVDRLPPEPRLEGIEDIRAGKWRWIPDRAGQYYAAQRKQLADGSEGAIPIDQAIDALADKDRLPAEKSAAPATFAARLPSKAASGRTPAPAEGQTKGGS